jgi:integrase
MLEVADPTYRAPIATLAMTGIRAGELLGLQWRDPDFLSRRITIEHSVWRGQLQTTKTEASERVIGMPHPLAQMLLNHRRISSFTNPDDFVFCQADGRPIDPDSLREYGIYAAMKRAGVPYVKRASGCHAFRHLAGSIIHKETGSLKLAQKQLGHSKEAKMCSDPKGNRLLKEQNDSAELLILLVFSRLSAFVRELVAGWGFEPRTFGL